MGVFPENVERAEALIFFAGMTARLGNSTKTVSKTSQEAIGIPDAAIHPPVADRRETSRSTAGIDKLEWSASITSALNGPSIGHPTNLLLRGPGYVRM